MALTFGSVCSGIEAASVAGEPLGWIPAWFSEIEPFPCELLDQLLPVGCELRGHDHSAGANKST